MAGVQREALNLPVLAETDVLVVGGGPSGLAAAISAARSGVSVILMEQFGCFGGNITVVGVEGFAWYRHPGTIEAGGLTFEFERRFVELAGQNPECQSDSQALDAELFKIVADRMVEQSGIVPLLHCLAVDALIDGSTIRGVVTQSKSGRAVILAGVVIDCTGDADIAALSGAAFHIVEKEKMMSATTLFNCRNVNVERFRKYISDDLKPTYKDWGGYWSIETTGKEDDLFSPYFERPFVEAAAEGIVSIPEGEKVSLGGTWSSIYDNGDVTQLNIVFLAGIDSTDVWDLTKAEILGRKYALHALEVLRRKVPGFEKARIRNFGMTVGVRESRRIEGYDRLTFEQVMNQGRCGNSIGIFPEFLDGAGYLVLPTTGRYFHIPYGCLVPKGIENLLVAGRAISGDDLAHISYRNMSCCVTTGQAAGAAAAESIHAGTTTNLVEIGKVQKNLLSQGVRIF